MPDERPNPDDLLALTKQTSTRGQLRVYLGMCPGVGKTYTMLEDAGRVGSCGAVVGIVETHSRAETEALAALLPSIPRRRVAYRNTEIDEFDLDETLRRKPPLVPVDELAHSNAPGSRHPKRWQDVEELLAASISVWTTLNIHHVESVRDDVMAIVCLRSQHITSFNSLIIALFPFRFRRPYLCRQCSSNSILLFLLIGPDSIFIRVSFFMTQRPLSPLSFISSRCHSMWRNAGVGALRYFRLPRSK